ncbi:unnamed protein product [Calypogeia fissa]
MDMKGMAKEGLWAGLAGEVLAEIFSKLPFEDKMVTVPLVCKAWKDASRDPICWRKVDMNKWYQKKVEENYWWQYEFECETEIEFYIRKVVDRSKGHLTELHTMHCSDSVIEHIAETCPSLEVLSIPNSLLVTDKSAAKLAANCCNLERLDISDCYNISKQALEAFGQSCTSLVWLGRNMLNQDQVSVDTSGPERGGDEEAIVMSKYMGKLKHLEMKRTSLSDLGLAHLTQGCKQLETLDLACCSLLSLRALEDASKQCVNLTEFTKPMAQQLTICAIANHFLFTTYGWGERS